MTEPLYDALLLLSEGQINCLSLVGAGAGDKCLFCFMLATLWWQLGGNYSASNVFNVAGILNFWVTMPAFG